MDNLITFEDVADFRRKSILPEGSRLTRFGQTSVNIGEATFSFDYRRDFFEFDLDKNKYCYLGVPKVNDENYFKTFLTNSGQAAINACYFYCDKILKIKEIESHNDYLYVGAYKLQELYKIKHSKNKSPVLWICSTATTFKKALELEGQWEVVIVDTTCWAVDSENLQLIYDKYINMSSKLIFYRSHSKLDMGGVEYGSLGNLTIFSSSLEIFSELAGDFKKIFGLNGGYASLDEIPPYLMTEQFFQMTKKRCQKIVENTKYVEAILKDESYIKNSLTSFVFPDNYKYFLIRLNKRMEEREVKNIFMRLKLLLRLHFSEIKYCASYGFNFPNFTSYSAADSKEVFFRFSVGVIDESSLDRLCLCLKEVFK